MDSTEEDRHRLLKRIETLEQENDTLKQQIDNSALGASTLSDEHYRLLIEESSDPIFSFTPEGRYIYVNNIFATSVQKAQQYIIGNTIWDVFEKDEADQRFSFLKRAFDTGEVQTLEVRVPNDSGDLYYITTVTPIFDEHGNIPMAICISKDITTRKVAELKLQKSEHHLRLANATKDKFFSIIAHDLKNPFHAILGLSELLSTNIKQNDFNDVEELNDAISSACSNTYKLLENLLEWSNVQTGAITFHPQKLNLKQIISETSALFLNSAKSKGILLSMNVDSELSIYADKNMLNTIIRNLISNAIKFSHKDGEISLSATQETEHITITIADKGIGIAPEHLEKLFVIDEKESHPGTQQEIGTGLGLILSNEFVKMHKGDIRVTSTLHKGSTFIFTIPIIN